jgi:hypothetical protein
MSQYPINNEQALYEAVNYLASGPSGLGQNFQGFSSYQNAYLTGNFRKPYSQATTAQLNVPPVACSSAVQLGNSTFQYNFATTQATPPFALGNNISGSGWSNDFYNGYQGAIGVIACTTDYVIFQTSGSYPGVGDDTGGGNVYLNNMSYPASDNLTPMSTDCNARVIVYGATDRVFIGSQLTNTISYVNPGAASDLTYRMQVNRYTAFPNNDPINPDFVFSTPKTIFEKVYNFTALSGPGTLPEIETIFSTIIDEPTPGYYWYILEVRYDVADDSELYISDSVLGLRSMSAQVVKQ